MAIEISPDEDEDDYEPDEDEVVTYSSSAPSVSSQVQAYHDRLSKARGRPRTRNLLDLTTLNKVGDTAYFDGVTIQGIQPSVQALRSTHPHRVIKTLTYRTGVWALLVEDETGWKPS